MDAKQLEYALSDVTHLVPVYEHLRGKLAESGREHWLDEEFAALADPETYIVHPEDVWQKIKHRSHNGRLLTVLRELAAWRERRAQSKDTPRQSIIRDDCLLNIAAACPDCREDLEKNPQHPQRRRYRQTRRRNSGSHSKAVKIPPSAYVKPEHEKMLPVGAAALYELLRLLLKIRSQEQGVIPRLIASDDDLKRLAVFSDRKNPCSPGLAF